MVGFPEILQEFTMATTRNFACDITFFYLNADVFLANCSLICHFILTDDEIKQYRD